MQEEICEKDLEQVFGVWKKPYIIFLFPSTFDQKKKKKKNVLY